MVLICWRKEGGMEKGLREIFGWWSGCSCSLWISDSGNPDSRDVTWDFRAILMTVQLALMCLFALHLSLYFPLFLLAAMLRLPLRMGSVFIIGGKGVMAVGRVQVLTSWLERFWLPYWLIGCSYPIRIWPSSLLGNLMFLRERFTGSLHLNWTFCAV